MAELVLIDVDNNVLHSLEERARRHGRTLAEEAKVILAEAVHGGGADAWARVDAIYHRLAASGRTFSDSAELLREDRDRQPAATSAKSRMCGQRQEDQAEAR